MLAIIRKDSCSFSFIFLPKPTAFDLNVVRSDIVVRKKKHALTADTVRASLMRMTHPGEKMFTLIQGVKVRTSGPAAASWRTVRRNRKRKKKEGRKKEGLRKRR